MNLLLPKHDLDGPYKELVQIWIALPHLKMLHDKPKECYALEQPHERQIMSAEIQKAMQKLKKNKSEA